ncbi:unnamed protein product [Closterium sp. Naga37s-1]|nr:unnamed protein product [Closterium sp. Naga37s-1]
MIHEFRFVQTRPASFLPFSQLAHSPLTLTLASPCLPKRCRRFPRATMGHETVWNSHPKKHSPGARLCRVCGNCHGMIRKYGLNCCRQCFRTYSKDIGFIKHK